ncbi:MAG: PEP/pyruvate-binding domain-containing protein [Pseudomonadota bacterium]
MIWSMAEADRADAGGKGRALAQAAAKGFAVPEFCVIASGAEPDRAALDAALAAMGEGPFAVRSSGMAEDGAEASHAGQYDTILNVARGDVAGAIAKVAASGVNAGIAAYRAERGVTSEAAPAVVVQRMIPASHAGVAFSADPVNGRRDRIVISATQELGDRLVAGEVDGSSWWLAREGFAVAERSGEGEGLTEDQIAEIAQLALEAEAAFGAPQDIEWALSDGALYLLQTRPITSPLRAAPLADPGYFVFDNSNIVESYPGIVSPLTFTFASYAYARVYMSFVALLGVDPERVRAERVVFENMLSRIDGRVYYNLGNWHRALAMLPGYALNRGFMDGMMGVSEPLPERMLAAVEAEQPKKWREYGRMARSAWLLWRASRKLPATSRDFRARLDRALAATAPERVRELSLTQLASEYRAIEADLLDRWDAPIVNDFLCMMAFGAARKALENWAGDEGTQILNDVLIGQGDIISARPAQLIRAMGETARDDEVLLAALDALDIEAVQASVIGAQVAGYIEEFGDRCTEELKLESVTLDEDPGPLFAAIAAAARSPLSVLDRASDPWARMKAAFKGRPIKRRVASSLTRWAKARVRDRENLRYERTRIFGRARRVLLAMGAQFHARGMIEAPRDVFLLTLPEVLGAIEGFGVTADLAALIDVRRAEMERAQASPDPHERLIVEGPACAAASSAPPTLEDGDLTTRKGTGASAGTAEAVARVISDPRGQSIAAGEILVARHTDPGWIALFASAAAIVVERGSLLSHSAIVARELGIPCVVGLKDATRWIADGEVIRVDGGSGSVERSGVQAAEATPS